MQQLHEQISYKQHRVLLPRLQGQSDGNGSQVFMQDNLHRPEPYSGLHCFEHNRRRLSVSETLILLRFWHQCRSVLARSNLQFISSVFEIVIILYGFTDRKLGCVLKVQQLYILV